MKKTFLTFHMGKIYQEIQSISIQRDKSLVSRQRSCSYLCFTVYETETPIYKENWLPKVSKLSSGIYRPVL